MNFLSALYRTYNQAELAGLVDNHDGNGTVLLPIYHTSLKSDGKNIIKIIFNNDGDFFKAEILGKEEEIIFPVTEDSASRSGKYPAAHPITDKLSYYLSKEEIKNADYLSQFKNFFNSLDMNSDCYRFMSIIEKFVTKTEIVSIIAKSLFEGEDFHVEGPKIIILSKSKKSEIDLSNYFLTFEILNFKDKINYNVTTFHDLHKTFIRYIDSQDGNQGLCCISGEVQKITTKHRGIMGNAKIISVSNNKETYYGRFKDKGDILSVGYRTSEKAHLMLKYLLENKNSSKWLGEQQYLVNWFSKDIENKQNFDITEKLITRVVKKSNTTVFKPVTLDNDFVGKTFITGVDNIDKDSRYYIGIIDKSSNGRISVKYFRELSVSELVQNLNNWNLSYRWRVFNSTKEEHEERTPSFIQIINATFGIERDEKLEVQSESFLKDSYSKMIGYLIDGANIPKAISQQLATNIRQRHRYTKTWGNMLFVALAILNYERQGGYDRMVDKSNLNRSYLYGRLLAIYELIERTTFIKQNSNTDSDRVTNAQSYWTTYNRMPATTMKLLENKIKPYEKKLKVSKPGFYYKLEKEKEEIINKIHDSAYLNKVADKSLDFDFIFGYQAEINFVYAKKEEEK